MIWITWCCDVWKQIEFVDKFYLQSRGTVFT